ncbi:MAG: RNA polymerase sigma-70 factor [Ferruginibacter sp.]
MLLTKLFYPREPDSDLYRLVKQNDLKAFEELYTRYWPILVNSAYKRLNSKEKAEDIVQNIFIEIYQRRAVIEITISIRAYLNQALKFKILNEYRSEMNRAKYQKYLFFNPICKNDSPGHLEAKELEAEINSVLNNLPRKCRQVFLLSRKEILSNKDISIALNISLSTVEKHISKALKFLRSSGINN